MSDPKEPRFFQTEYEHGLDYYLSTYFKNYAGQTVVGDAAPQHLYLPYVVWRIHATVPTARLAVICRDPVDRAVSAYWHSASEELKPGLSTRRSSAISSGCARPLFRDGGRGDPLRRDRQEGPRPFAAGVRFYIEPGYYARYIELYQSLFGKDKLKILFFEDLQRDPNGTINQLLDFLGLPPIALRSQRAERGHQQAAARIIGSLAACRQCTHLPASEDENQGADRAFPEWRAEGQAEVSLAARRRLVEHYRPHNRWLAEITGRDLSHRDSARN